MNLLVGYELGLFGEIDKQVLAAKAERSATGDEVVDTVERLLPNTTGFGQAGWYQELEDFINENARNPDISPIVFPDLTQALGYLQTLTSGEKPFRNALDRSDTAPSTVIRSAPYEFLINYIATGAAYPSFILEKIRQVWGGGARFNQLGEALTILESLPSSSSGGDSPADSPRFITSVDMLEIRNNIDLIEFRDDWTRVLGPKIGAEFAKKSESCFGLLEEADGQYCGSIYTDYPESDLSIDDVKKVLHPRNWPHCSDFFHAVTAQDPKYAATGWSRLKETISPEPDEYLMNTALIFYFGKFDENGGIYLNYDIDTTKQGDSFLVHVDSGYICVTERPDKAPGVRIRTSKQERVDGLSPTATSALACHMGWGQLARDMLAGTARLVKAGKINESELTKFEFSPPNSTELKSDSGPVIPDSPELKPVALPGNFRDTVRDGQTLANDLIDRVTTAWGHAAKRWMDGMTREDIAATTQEIGKNLNEFAQTVYTTAENDFKGKPRKKDGG
jgi:hypothetical protein